MIIYKYIYSNEMYKTCYIIPLYQSNYNSPLDNWSFCHNRLI